MRHRLCVLPSDPNQGPTPGSLAHPSVVWCVTRLERTQAQVAQPRPRARRTSKRAVRRLRRQVPALRNGLRPSQGGRQVGRRHSNGWPCRARDHPCRSRQVRYRVCELPPSADVSSARECISSGSSSVGGASAFQAECRGFESRLPLQPPFQGLPRRNSANFPCRETKAMKWSTRSSGSCGNRPLCLAIFSWHGNLATNQARHVA
jgi:hypothetical protein